MHTQYCTNKFAQTRIIELLEETQRNLSDKMTFSSHFYNLGCIKSDFAKHTQVPPAFLPYGFIIEHSEYIECKVC